ncbi:MAG: serine/threonine protein kinase, partial [Alphaproteobacteria bacterium]|nr:serine/threonine protein kinase [Alphaproteobacteria bacterium]
MRRILPLCALLLSLLVTADAVAQARQPLLMEGKQTLFQRVLTRPGAALLDKPGGQQVSALPPLSIFYVYGRQGEHIEVGSNSAGRIAGWVKAEQAIDWKQSLVLTFANPAGRDRALFFAGEDAMLDMVEADDLAQQLAVIRRDIEAKGESSSEKIVAVEPKEFVDIRQQFYLLPILQARETALASGFRVKSVEVAS